MTVRRSNLFEDAYAIISTAEPKDLKRRLMIKFMGEEGLDYGGVSRYACGYDTGIALVAPIIRQLAARFRFTQRDNMHNDTSTRHPLPLRTT